MKMVIAVVQDKDSGKLIDALVEKGFRFTKLASTGGFLREGNTTLLIGTEDSKVDEVVSIVKQAGQSRRQMLTPMGPLGGPADSYMPAPVEVMVGGATIFVLDIERFEKA